MITFSPLTSANVEEVFLVEQKSFSHPWSLSSFQDELSNPNAVYFCLEEDGKPVGYIGMWNILGEGNITNVAVLPEYRRKGYGKALIAKMISYAIAENLEFLTLEVRASNEGAIRLYRACGFLEVGRRKKYYENTEDAILMTLEL